RDLRAGHGWYAFSEVLIFLVILAVGFVYVWVKGDLDWVKSTRAQRPAEAPAVSPPTQGGSGAPDRAAG
ncbi:MAG: NADH-quinone oxidoreductase subunit A, partial [Planctomycetales bacterium]|nr:NADH-quinone oxidoreductase subunit A [Planctomycetales bacterium]